MSTRVEAAVGAGSAGSRQLTGPALAVASISWTFLAAERSGGSALAWAATLAVSGSTFAIARSLTRMSPAAVPGLVVAAAMVLMAITFPALVSGTGFGPFGYSNADAAFFTQAMVAACMLGCAWRRPVARVGAFAAAILFAVIPIAGGARAVAVLCLLPVAALAAGRREVLTRAFATVGAVLCVATVAITVLLGATYQAESSGGIDEIVDATIGDRRVELWHDAMMLMSDDPLTGVGPGRWVEESPVARTDSDFSWAHNAFLEQGAETGVIGMALLLLILLWAFVYLGSNTAGGPYAALGVASLTAFGLHASIDYILEFPAVAVVTAVLVGAAGAGASIRGE